MKLGIVIDSSAGISKKDANKRGWGFLPLYLNIDGKDYADGIDITPEQYYDLVNINSEVRTSATPPGIAMDIIEKKAKENDYVLVYALSTGLSSQTNNIKMITQDLDNVFVVPSLGVGFAITRDAEELEKMAKSGTSWSKIKEVSIEMTNSLYGVAAPETLKWLVKGGRVSSGVASMANLLKIVPLISFENGKLEKYGKARVFRKAVKKVARELKEKFGDSVEYIIYHANNENISALEESIYEVIGHKIPTVLFPNVIVNHTGPGVVAIITRKKT